MTEPTCYFCGASDKHRCRTVEQANVCPDRERNLGYSRVPARFAGGNDKWDRRFLELAELVATWSKDPSSQVGAVIVDKNRRIVSTGYNGFPRGCRDDEAFYANRLVKYPRVVHAELNAILSAGGSVQGTTIYTTHKPCSGCSGAIIQAGIERVVYTKQEDYESRMVEDLNHAADLLSEANIRVSLRHK